MNDKRPKEPPTPPIKKKPVRDTQDESAPNPNGDQPDTKTREEIEKIRPNLKR